MKFTSDTLLRLMDCIGALENKIAALEKKIEEVDAERQENFDYWVEAAPTLLKDGRLEITAIREDGDDSAKLIVPCKSKPE